MTKEIKPKKILLIKLRKLGDVLNTTPAVRALRKQFPNAEITFLTEPLGAKVFEFSNEIDQLWTISRKPSNWEYLGICVQVYRYSFDLVVDFYQHNKTRIITLCSRAPTRVGFRKKRHSKATLIYNKSVYLEADDHARLYAPIHNLKLLESLGIKTQDYTISLPLDNSTLDYSSNFAQQYNITKKTIAFCAQSERTDGQVAPEILAQIGNFLIKRGYSLYFVYGPGERILADPVYAEIQNKSQCIIDYDIPTIAQVKAILAHCAMYIGNDGGNKHLALTAGIPTLGIFNGDAPRLWTPPDPTLHRFLQTKQSPKAFDDFMAIFASWSPVSGKFEAISHDLQPKTIDS